MKERIENIISWTAFAAVALWLFGTFVDTWICQETGNTPQPWNLWQLIIELGKLCHPEMFRS